MTQLNFTLEREFIKAAWANRAEALLESTNRSRSPYSCPHRSPVGTGGQRGALGVD